MCMNVSFDAKGDFDIVRKWLKEVGNRNPSTTLNDIAREGERRLASSTPQDTGETASSWKSEITTKDGITEVAWKNTAHPEASANVAKLIELGHGTGTGGYVAPRPYIKDAMKPIWDSTDKVVKELIK